MLTSSPFSFDMEHECCMMCLLSMTRRRQEQENPKYEYSFVFIQAGGGLLLQTRHAEKIGRF
jgi:hypothetical protein